MTSENIPPLWHARLVRFAERGAIGAYDADDLHHDVRAVLGRLVMLEDVALRTSVERDEAVMRRQELELELSDAHVNLRELRPAYEGEIAEMRRLLHEAEAQAKRDAPLVAAALAWLPEHADCTADCATCERLVKAVRTWKKAQDGRGL